MIRNLMALPCMLAFVLACGDGRMDDQNAGTAGSETGTLPGDTAFTGGGIEDTAVADTARMGGMDTAPRSDMSAPAADTAPGIRTGTGTATDADAGSDTGRATDPNQDQSGVTDTETGESELGGDVEQVSPDHGEPVTSKGDTVGVGGPGIDDTTD